MGRAEVDVRMRLRPTPLLALSFAPQALRATDPVLPSKFTIRWVAERKVWEVDARPYGRIRAVLFPGKRTPFKLVSREMAEEVQRTILADIEKGVPESVAVAPYLPGELLLERCVARWLKHLDAQVELGERSPRYVQRLHDFARPGAQFSKLYGANIHSIDLGELEDFRIKLRAGGESQTNTAHVLGSLRTCLRWIAKHSSGTYSAPEFPEITRGEYEPRVLTLEEQDAVLAQIPEPKRGAFLALSDLMIRPNEARAANVEDYDFSARELRVAHGMDDLVLGARRGKSKPRKLRRGSGPDKGVRILEVTVRLQSWIEEHVGSAARMARAVPLFANPDGRSEDGRFSYYTLADRWREACRDAGLRPIGLYEGTKHSTSTALRRAGLSLAELGLAMGHAPGSRSEAVTEGYARPGRVANANIVRLLESRRGQ